MVDHEISNICILFRVGVFFQGMSDVIDSGFSHISSFFGCALCIQPHVRAKKMLRV